MILAYVAFVWLGMFSDRLIFQPHPSSYRQSELSAAGIDDVHPLTFHSGQKRISAVYLPNESARYTLLFSHGNAEDIGDDLAMLEEFRRAGFSVFAYDYRGYGDSEGVSSEKSLYEDVGAAYEYVTGTLHVVPDQVISFGRSLGCAAAIDLAAKRPVGGLIIEAPFLSAFRVLTRVRLLPWDKFDNASKMRLVRAPVLVIHGRSDGVVPFWHGQQMYKLANEPKRHLWVDRAGHNDILLFAAEQYFTALKEFSLVLDRARQAR